MADPTTYNPIWLHGMVGGPPGVCFGGWSLLPSHARKSYGVDPLSDTVVNFVGDVFLAQRACHAPGPDRLEADACGVGRNACRRRNLPSPSSYWMTRASVDP